MSSYIPVSDDCQESKKSFEIGDKVVDVVYDEDKTRGRSPVYKVTGIVYEVETTEGKRLLYRPERLRYYTRTTLGEV